MLRQRSVQFHGRRMGLEIGCRVDILNKSRRPIPNLVNCGVLRFVGMLHFTCGR